MTQARRAVLEVLDGSEGAGEHLNAEEIAQRAAGSAPGLHRATVYRALTTLGELGVVAHTHVGGSAAVYHLMVDPVTKDAAVPPTQHGHLQCTACGTVIDVPVELLRPLARRLQQDLDFRLAPEHTALLGTCSRCAAPRP